MRLPYLGSMPASLAGRAAFVVGATDDLARRVAVALAEAGATVSTVTTSDDKKDVFKANSILNELWSMGRAGAAFVVTEEAREDLITVLERSESPLVVVMPQSAQAPLVQSLSSDFPAAVVVRLSSSSGDKGSLPVEILELLGDS